MFLHDIPRRAVVYHLASMVQFRIYFLSVLPIMQIFRRAQSQRRLFLSGKDSVLLLCTIVDHNRISFQQFSSFYKKCYNRPVLEGKLAFWLFWRHICKSEASELLRKPLSESSWLSEESWEDAPGVGILSLSAWLADEDIWEDTVLERKPFGSRILDAPTSSDCKLFVCSLANRVA